MTTATGSIMVGRAGIFRGIRTTRGFWFAVFRRVCTTTRTNCSDFTARTVYGIHIFYPGALGLKNDLTIITFEFHAVKIEKPVITDSDSQAILKKIILIKYWRRPQPFDLKTVQKPLNLSCIIVPK